MLLSVIMPVYNETKNELVNSITSILHQTFTNFEFIIVDDNPNSVFIKKFLTKESHKDDRIKLLFNKSNIGPSESTNKGILYSNGELIARMDADDVSLPTRFQKQIAFIRHNNLDFNCFNFSLVSLQGKLIKRNCYSNISQTNQRKIRRIMSYCSITNGPSFMFKRKVFDYVGGYRARWIEDYDFASRVLVDGFRIGYLSKSLMYKRVRSDSISNSNALKQFAGLHIISEYLRKYNFKEMVPSRVIDNEFNSINSSDTVKFRKLQQDIQRFKQTHSILLLIKSLRLVLSSKLLFELYLWRKLVNNRQDKLIQ